MNTLHIKVFVDVIALLSGEPTKRSVHMFDDGGAGSKGQGTNELVSAASPGQFIKWSINALDVQTQVWMKDIKFGSAPTVMNSVDDDSKAEHTVTTDEVPLWGKSFEGFMPFNAHPKSSHSYYLNLAFSEGCKRVFTVDGPKLLCVSPNITQ
jgi:hypothetical protein